MKSVCASFEVGGHWRLLLIPVLLCPLFFKQNPNTFCPRVLRPTDFYSFSPFLPHHFASTCNFFLLFLLQFLFCSNTLLGFDRKPHFINEFSELASRNCTTVLYHRQYDCTSRSGIKHWQTDTDTNQLDNCFLLGGNFSSFLSSPVHPLRRTTHTRAAFVQTHLNGSTHSSLQLEQQWVERSGGAIERGENTEKGRKAQSQLARQWWKKAPSTVTAASAPISGRRQFSRHSHHFCPLATITRANSGLVEEE